MEEGVEMRVLIVVKAPVVVLGRLARSELPTSPV